jgi:hypothetical protein
MPVPCQPKGSVKVGDAYFRMACFVERCGAGKPAWSVYKPDECYGLWHKKDITLQLTYHKAFINSNK